jgi:predicted transposase YdaD
MYQDIVQESWVYQEILQEGREQGLEEGREQALRQTLISCIETRFPALAPLAKQQADMIKDSTVLHRVIVKLFSVQTDEEAERYLLTLSNDAKKN